MASHPDSLRRFLGGGSVEVGLAGLLFVMELIGHRPDDPASALPLAFLTCAGAGLAAWHTRIGAAISCLGFTAAAIVVPDVVTGSIYAPLVVILACAWRDDLWAGALASVWGYALSIWLSFRNTTTTAEDAQALLLWLGFYILPWILGLALRRVQRTERQRLTAQSEAQRCDTAAELHDNVTHDLAQIIARAQAARLDPEADRDVALADIVARGRRASAYLTNLMRVMRVGTPSPSVSLAEELQTGERTLAAAGFDMQIYTDCDVDAIAPEVSDVLGRIAREAFHNIAHHGDPTESCEATVRADKGRIAVSFTNATSTPYGGDGLGIIGMRERAELIGGTLRTRLSDGFWSLKLSVPITADSAKIPVP
ncbi:histidine kinase [Acidipropionibacterium jensenii]|uniref:sensor histidine kinase n=1 Tax=Acidipropionibacterium jensenii TaxID=1749 RepID=UPI000BC2F7BA|nr:histidine kinase [Acidipropionibacterium jensenii]AZZ43038.1 histidine kinase [Acidipropionibacterium jensenii]